MSFEEDTELRHLVAQTLENKGILPKIRAELRANVFLALEENPSTKETLLKNNELSAFVKIPIGSLILNLIREFLEFFELEFTLSVFDPETKYGKEYNGLSKDKMIKELKLTECSNNSPLLYKVIERVINGSNLNGTTEKSQEDLNHCDLSGGSDDDHLIPSPTGLNSTYIKGKPDLEYVPESPTQKENKDEENESIKEELISNNVSESESLEDPKFKLTLKVENPDSNLPSSSNTKESKSPPQKTVPEKHVEIDLLTFTPVKENKVTHNEKNCSSTVQNESKPSGKKEMEGTILGDLPPLTLKSDENEAKMSQIKAIIDRWPGLENEDESSVGKSSIDQIDEKSTTILKSDRSDYSQNSLQKSEITGDLEDLSDLINGHTSSFQDGQLTVDETISKTSCSADYLESL